MDFLKNINSDKGFTIVELLVYIAMLLVVIGALYSILTTNTRSYSSQENKVAMVQDLRATMELITTEIRMAGYDPTGIGDVGFIDDGNDNWDTDGTSIRFTMDTDGDGAIATSEDINYYLNGSAQLVRREQGDATEQVLAENITALGFQYGFEDGDTDDEPNETDADNTNDREDIRSVQVSITGRSARVDPITGNWRTKTAESWLVVRNAGLE
jgi:type IV pilus assembly protein PilW